MRFRPCIDIHNGNVKQIVGGSLTDQSGVDTNFVSEEGGAFYGELYRRLGLAGGHIILLNPAGTPEYEADLVTAREALAAYPGGLQIGGGVTAENAAAFLDMGATHVIVTSYVFREGRVDMDRLNRLVSEVGQEHLVLDLSCRKTVQGYCIATDRWQKLTDTYVNYKTLDRLRGYADEFLIHAVDAEGKRNGIEEELAKLLGDWQENALVNSLQLKAGSEAGDQTAETLPDRNRITYAGGVGSFEDLDLLKKLGGNRLDVTIGSALDIFGGEMKLTEILDFLAS